MATAQLQQPQQRIRADQFRAGMRRASRVNVGETERWLSLLGGGALAIFGLTRQSERGPATAIPAGRGAKVEEAMTINRPAKDLYDFWRDFERLPHFMKHLESVRKTGGNRSHWVAKGPLGMRVEWDAEIYNENPNEMIAWRSLEGSEVDTTGSIHFRPAPAGRGTEVRVVLKYDPPAGKAGALAAKLFGKDPEGMIREDLCRFKQLMEAGEMATVEGQTSCRA
jgi:uncharacterized membrane protein